MQVSGTLRKFTVNGIPFNIKGDVDADENLMGKEVEGVPHTGGTSSKITLVPAVVEGIVLILENDDYDYLSDNQGLPVSMMYERADGGKYRTDGFYKLNPRKTANNECSLDATSSNRKWTRL